MTPCRCSVCTADRWGHRLIGFVAGLLLAHLLWSLILVSAASRSAVHPGAPVPSWADAGGRRTGAPHVADRPVRHGGERLKTRTMRPGGAPTPAGRTEMSERLIPMPAPSLGTLSDVVVEGIASTFGPGWDGWIAWPKGPGFRLHVCGPADCRDVTSNDAGPDLEMQRAPHNRIIDLDVRTFESVCGVPWTRGLCRVTVEPLP